MSKEEQWHHYKQPLNIRGHLLSPPNKEGFSMQVNRIIGRKISSLLSETISSLGVNPSDFYRKNDLYRRVWRIQTGQSFSCKGLVKILEMAQQDAQKREAHD